MKGNWTRRLQYWSPTQIPVGSIINAPLKGKTISAFVFDCTPIKEAKSTIKEADFKTRKIENAEPQNIVPSEFIRAVLKTSTFFVQNPGAMLKGTIPACAFLYNSNLSGKESRLLENKNDKPNDVVAISTNTEDRHSSYKSMIREELARKKSVLLITPTVRTAEILFESIKKGIEHVTILMHGSLSKKKMDEVWGQAIESERSIVVIATPQFMSIPRTDIGTIILEGESSRAYKTFNPPFFDWRHIAEIYARELGIKLVLGDQMLRLETIERVQNQEIYEVFPLSYRIQKEAEIIIVDMVESKRKAGEFRILSEELDSMIEYAQKKKQNMFIFASRRGLSPQTICADCHQTVICNNCSSPVVLHKSSKGERYFLCHHCGKDRTALEACTKCNSWNLTTLGIGSDTVYAEIKRKYPKTPIFRIDKDAAKTEKEAKKIAADFHKEEGAILIGTETALSYIDKVKLVSVASMDSLFSIPDFRINERIAHICLRLFEIAESYVLIQTRNAETSIIKAIASKTLADFVKEELSIRKALNYPPFSIMGKISLSGPNDHTSKQAKKIETMIKECEPTIFPAMVPSSKGPIINILFTLPQEIWQKESRINSEIFQKLELISLATPIQINPESFI